MTARLIKLAFAAMITAIATVSPQSPQLKAAALGGSSANYTMPAVIELHSSMPTLLAWASKLSGYPVPETLPRVLTS